MSEKFRIFNRLQSKPYRKKKKEYWKSEYQISTQKLGTKMYFSLSTFTDNLLNNHSSRITLLLIFCIFCISTD